MSGVLQLRARATNESSLEPVRFLARGTGNLS